MNYQQKLKDPRWQKKRLEIMQRDGFACIHCNDTETTLHVHHLKYTGNPWDAPESDLQTLCEHCHDLVTNLLKKDESITRISKVKGDGSYGYQVDTLDDSYDRCYHIIHVFPDQVKHVRVNTNRDNKSWLLDFVKGFEK